MIVTPYTRDDISVWDKAVAESRNGTFQHFRAYMDYHSDRFDDCSLIARDDHNRVVAVLPAHKTGTTICSHKGLTFGGWIMSARADMRAVMEIWRLMAEHYRVAGFTELYYRPAPHIYHRYPAEEDLYALFRAGGQLVSSQVSSVINLATPIGFDGTSRRKVNKGSRLGIACSESSDLASFWEVLSTMLLERHNTLPVHTLEEIRLLQERFPKNIRLYTATLDGQLLAGVLMYYSDTVAHCQYIAASPEGRDLNALPCLFDYLIAEAHSRGLQIFDFGTSCERGGLVLNEGLVRQKCGFGARAVVYNAYTVMLQKV
ncbi:MAG: GNAT family N-acetyltransferase [Muribaculaceae bacterium]|nr:GNAT family N-acetyltransferase [Muribaculaceae bacterium]